jgi:replication factor A1
MAVSEEDGSKNAIVAVRAVRVGDYNGCSINTTRASMVEVNPDRKEAHDLREWYAAREGGSSFQPVGSTSTGKGGAYGPAPRKGLADIAGQSLGMADKPDIFTVRAMITYFRNKDKDGKDHIWQYPSNPSNKKKVVESNGQWLDESTNEVLDNCQRRYILGFSCW